MLFANVLVIYTQNYRETYNGRTDGQETL